MNKKIFNYIFFLLLISSFCMLVINAEEYKKYSLDDYIFYDPFYGENCSNEDYWTIYNKDTTCYRFFIINPSDNKESSTVAAILDHDITKDTFDNRYNALNKNTSEWMFDGVKRFISEEEIGILFRFNKLSYDEKNGSYINTNKNVISVGAYHSTIGQMITNSYYFNNYKEYNSKGFWSDSVYNDKYAYSIDENGKNKLVKKGEKIGIRPVLEFEKNRINPSNLREKINIEEKYKYSYDKNGYDGYRYKQMQGFTMTRDRLVFYSSNGSNPNFGLIYGYEGKDYSKKIGGTPSYYEGGHGNSIAYDVKNNQVLSLDPYNKRIAVFNNYDLSLKGYIKLKKSSYDSIAYDDIHDYYIFGEGRKIYIADKKLNVLYSIDATTYGINQGIDYHNGYIYKSIHYASCNNNYQTHCTVGAYKGDIYVYNAKINSNGRANPNFGKLEKIYHISNNKYGELEDLAFFNNNLYLGYSARTKDKVNVFKIFYIDGKTVMPTIKVNKKYKLEGDKLIVTLFSTDELSEVKGWTKVNNNTISKEYSKNSKNESVNICDKYNNCTKVNININDMLDSIKNDITNIVADKASVVLDIGDSEKLDVRILPSTVFDRTVIWKSNNPDIAYVDENGFVIGLKEGKTYIKVTNVKGTAYTHVLVKVNGPKSGIQLKNDIINMKPQDIKKIDYQLFLDDKSNKKLIWTSNNEDIAKVDENGIIHSYKEGSTVISVSTVDGSESNKCTVVVSDQLVRLEFLDKNINIDVKESKKINYSMTPYSNDELTWTSSNNKILKVDSNGVITGLSKGIAQITARNKDNTIFNSAIVIVNNGSHFSIGNLLKIIGIVLSICTYIGIFIFIRKHYSKM